MTLFLFAAGCDDPGRIRSGAELFQLQGCITCHAKDGAGSPLGPDLRVVQQHWKRETLVEYLKDPLAYQKKDDRLRAQGRKFLQPMPMYGMLRPEELANIADHILGMSNP